MGQLQALKHLTRSFSCCSDFEEVTALGKHLTRACTRCSDPVRMSQRWGQVIGQLQAVQYPTGYFSYCSDLEDVTVPGQLLGQLQALYTSPRPAQGAATS